MHPFTSGSAGDFPALASQEAWTPSPDGTRRQARGIAREVENYGSPEYVVGVGVGRPPASWILRKFSAAMQPFVQSEGDAMPGGMVLQSYPCEAIARSQPC